MEFIIFILVAMIIVLCIIGVIMYGEISKLEMHIKAEKSRGDQFLTASIDAKQEFNILHDRFEKLQHQKISADVKLGQKLEHVAGLMEDFPAPLHTLKFLGAPIDFVSIDLEKELITFIEVKSGQSQLSTTQKKIRKIIREKNVEFKEFRIGEKGISVK